MCIIKGYFLTFYIFNQNSSDVGAILDHLKDFKFWSKNLLILQLGFTQDLISPSKITISQKRVSIYSSLLIFIIHQYCGMFYNPRRVIVSNIDTLRCTQQAHVKISQKFKICSKSHYLRLWAEKCATCVHIQKFFVVSSIHTRCLSKSILVAREYIPAELWLVKVQKCSKNDLKKNHLMFFFGAHGVVKIQIC